MIVVSEERAARTAVDSSETAITGRFGHTPSGGLAIESSATLPLKLLNDPSCQPTFE
ncbi:MAG: hypothetical protein ACRDTE_17530 [Pseudonocardiaceae bacterium]